MSERPFITVPVGVWLRDPALNGCTEDSITIFETIAFASTADWRIEVAPANHAFSVRQCFKNPDRFRRWSEERINRCLAELRARGCLILATTNDREWLEVPDRLCYCKGHKPEKALDPPTQVPLALSPELTLFALPTGPTAIRGEKKRKEHSDVPPASEASPPVVHTTTTTEVAVGNSGGWETGEPEGLSRLGIDALKERFKAAGANLEKEEANWRARCKARGWSEDEQSWRTWLINGIKRKPLPKRKPSSSTTGPALSITEAMAQSMAIADAEARRAGVVT